jgi:Restriction endonuclease
VADYHLIFVTQRTHGTAHIAISSRVEAHEHNGMALSYYDPSAAKRARTAKITVPIAPLSDKDYAASCATVRALYTYCGQDSSKDMAADIGGTVRNDGRDLETLVRGIEEYLSPKDWKITSRKKAYSDNGAQIAEFDIVIEGKIGSASVNWLIECRDRPSAGRAPANWIEQLSGRQKTYGFDRVFAVSTTGFSDGALEVAKKLSVNLRSVKTFSELVEDFSIKTVICRLTRVTRVQLLCGKKMSGEDVQYILGHGVGIKRTREAGYLTFREFIMRHLREIPVGAMSPGHQAMTVRFGEQVDLAFRGIYNESIRDAYVDIEFEATFYKPEVITARMYSEDGRVLMHDGQFKMPPAIGAGIYEVQFIQKPDGTYDMVYRFDESSLLNFFNDDVDLTITTDWAFSP